MIGMRFDVAAGASLHRRADYTVVNLARDIVYCPLVSPRARFRAADTSRGE
jgi:hypothetical protein